MSNEMLAFDLIIILSSIIVLGEPLRAFICRYFHVFLDLDMLQILILDVFLGGFLLYILASFPSGLFSIQVLTILLVFSIVFIVTKFFRMVAKIKFKSFSTILQASTFVHFISGLCALMTFTLVLWIELTPMKHVVLGSIDDVSLNSLFVQVLVNNKMIPSTLMPFLPETIVYPQGHTVFFALASVLYNWVSAKAVFYITPLFIALSTLGAYFLGKKISGNPGFGAVLSFVTGFVATHPRYLTWGGNAFIVAFPFFMVCLGILFSNTKITEKTNIELLVMGLLLGYLGAIYLTALLVIALLLISDAIYNTATKGINFQNIKRYLLLLSASIVIIIPNIFKFLSFYFLPGQNVGIPGDISGYLTSYIYPGPLWALVTIATLSLPLLNFFALFFIVFGIYTLVRAPKANFEKGIIKIAIGMFIVPSILLLFANMPILEVRMLTGASTCVFVFISFNLLIAFAMYSIVTASISVFSLNTLRINNIGRWKKKEVFLVLTVLLTLLFPFVSYSVFNDEVFITGSYNVFAVTSQTDYSLMLWMKDNLNQTSTKVLVNRYDGGNFIPSVSNIVAIYPSMTASHLSASYHRVIDNLHLGKISTSEYDFIEQHNITHVFVGSNATFWWTGDHTWYPEVFLDNPNFSLVKKIGKSYLFKFNY